MEMDQGHSMGDKIRLRASPICLLRGQSYVVQPDNTPEALVPGQRCPVGFLVEEQVQQQWQHGADDGTFNRMEQTSLHDSLSAR